MTQTPDTAAPAVSALIDAGEVMANALRGSYIVVGSATRWQRALDALRALPAAPEAGEVERLRSQLKRVQGAAKTMLASQQEITRHKVDQALGDAKALRQIDRSEYAAAAMLESERQANAILTADLERAEARLAEVEAERDRLTDLIRWAHDTLIEINPSNYDHDDVCRLNNASVEVILGIAPEIGETHGKTPEFWAERQVKAGAVTVKPLVWEVNGSSRWRSGIYQITYQWGGDGRYHSSRLNGLESIWDIVGSYPSLEAAKAAAQAEFDRRILAALSQPAPASAGVTVKQAAQVLLACNGADLDEWTEGVWPCDDAIDALKSLAALSQPAQGGDSRPVNCRFRLQDEGKPYPRSSCQACGKGVFTGLGNTCAQGGEGGAV